MATYLDSKTKKDGKWIYEFTCTCPGTPYRGTVVVVLPDDDEPTAFQQANDQCENDCGAS